MISKIFLSLEVAKKIGEVAHSFAEKNGWLVAISIVNEAGQLVYYSKMDGSTNASGPISIAKAEHAANYRRDTKFHEDLLKAGNQLVLSLLQSLPIEGGVQLMYKGQTIGAIGVSGAASAEDGEIARNGADVLKEYEGE